MGERLAMGERTFAVGELAKGTAGVCVRGDARGEKTAEIVLNTPLAAFGSGAGKSTFISALLRRPRERLRGGVAERSTSISALLWRRDDSKKSMAIPLLLQLALSGGEMIAGFFRAGVQSLISVPTSGGVCRCRLRNDGEATSDAYLDRVEPCDLGVVGMMDFDGEKRIRRGGFGRRAPRIGKSDHVLKFMKRFFF